jgi:glutamate-ammonia-ligase adenylyltransferase
LWETFLKSRHEELFPLLANAEQLSRRECREALRLDLENQSGSAVGAAAWAVLNDFKDRHLFRIDMRHVLGHCRPFGAFSQELTELAELIVCRAFELAWTELTATHGTPRSSNTQARSMWMAGALGKFGGVEMGFASDLELLLVYEAAGQTDGGSVISNAEFFDRLIRLVESGIRAPQDGIFHVDLRMRPYGQAGPGAVMLSDFREYYREGGPAWPYEKQALVRLRSIAGRWLRTQLGRRFTSRAGLILQRCRRCVSVRCDNWSVVAV